MIFIINFIFEMLDINDTNSIEVDELQWILGENSNGKEPDSTYRKHFSAHRKLFVRPTNLTLLLDQVRNADNFSNTIEPNLTKKAMGLTIV